MSKKFAPKLPPVATGATTGPVTYPAYNANPITLEEEVVAGVIEWYMALGQPVPPEDLEACRGIDAAARAEVAAEMAAPAAVAPPAYGTPEFWKQWWAKKRAKAIAEGTPLPEPKKKGKPGAKVE